MASQNQATVAFNAGEIGQEVLQRTSLETYPNTASMMENWIPTVAGPMSFRPGLFHCVPLGTGPAWLARFQFDVSQAYLLVFGENTLSIVDDVQFITRPGAATPLNNTDFATDLSGWTADIPVLPATPPNSGGTGNTGNGDYLDFGGGGGGSWDGGSTY